MTVSSLALGHCVQIVRAFDGHFPDPLSLYAALTNGGTRPDTMFLESAAHLGSRGEKSLLVVRSALRLLCRGREVEVQALTANGEQLLPWLAEHLAGTVKIELAKGRLTATFPASLKGSEQARLHAPSPVDVLRLLARGVTLDSGQESFGPLVAGLFAYDFLGAYEQLPPPREAGLGWPDYEFWLPEQVVWLNHTHRQATAVAFVFGGSCAAEVHHDAVAAIAHMSGVYRKLPESPEASSHEVPRSDAALAQVAVDADDAAYRATVARLQAHIVAGDVIQIVPSRTFSLPCYRPLDAYRALRSLNPSPYMFWIQSRFGTLFGASPETAVKVSGRSRTVEIRPIAGTRRRGLTALGTIDRDLDNRLEAELRLSSKENAEHMMLVDLARNDVARVSKPGTRGVAHLLHVDKYSHVMHLVSVVEGELREDLDALHAYVATMNMGTLVGAPKLKAAELLRLVEPTARGPYGGAVGMYTSQGDFDSCIVIRSAVVKDGMAYVRAGAGVVYDSDPQAEADETRHKAAAVLRAIALAEASEDAEGAR